MKKFLIKSLSLTLILASLLPLAVACKEEKPPKTDDPPTENNNGSGDNNEENNMENYYFKLNVDSKTDSKLIDFTDSAFISQNNATSKIKVIDSKTVLQSTFSAATSKDNATQVKLYLPEQKSLEYCTSIRFELYNEKAVDGATVELLFLNPKKPYIMNNDWGAAIKIPLDFSGWKSFDFHSNQISGYGARDNVVDSFVMFATTPEAVTLALTSIDITTESYSYTAPEGVDVNDSTLYTAITDNARDIFIGNAEVADTVQYKNNIASINSACKSSLKMVNDYKAEFGDTLVENKLFGIVVEKKYWAGEQATQEFYKYVTKMAIAYGMIGSDYYKSTEVLDAILFCLDYAYEFYNGPSLIEGGAYGNWWQWEIGTPIELLQILVIIEDKINPELCEKYLVVFDHYVPYPSAKGGNKIWLSRLFVLSAALRRDALDLCIAGEYMNDLFDYIDNYIEDEGGFFEDGSFIQHSYYAYTTGYGGNYMGDLPQMMYYLKDSRFYPQQENVNNHFEWVIDAFRPVIYEKCVMNAMAGRNVGRYVGEDARSYAANMILIHSYAPDKYKAELENMIAYFMQLYNTDFSYQVQTFLIPYAKQLYEKLKDVQVDPYEITRVFGMMARTVHHGVKYGVCLSYSNNNVGKYESINSENMTGWYHGDGMIQIYTDGYSFNGDFYCFANPYLMPGVTANSSNRVTTTFGQVLINASNYAGGVSQGKYGTTGFILDYAVDSHQTFADVNGTSIYAKKSYFFFDNEIICVGSDISDKSGTNVLTTLDNRYWRPSGETITVGNTAISAPATVETEINERVLHFTNMGGYVILRDDGAKLYYKKATNTYNGTTTTSKDGTRDFFELYLDHGVGNTSTGKLENSAYFYAYLPEATVQETNAYYAAPDVDILARNTNTHAVIEKKLGIVACNFFNETTASVNVSASTYGSVTGVRTVTSETPSSIMVTKNADSSYSISISDPTQSYRNTIVSIEIDGITSVSSADEKVTASVTDGVVSILINSENSLGQTFNLTVK